MTPRQPRSTLFPYTTLFRSRASPAAIRKCICASARGAVNPGFVLVRAMAFADWCRTNEESLNGIQRKTPPDLDRKSTRLNSSHLGISYAVFCLKKKKKKVAQ